MFYEFDIFCHLELPRWCSWTEQFVVLHILIHFWCKSNGVFYEQLVSIMSVSGMLSSTGLTHSRIKHQRLRP